LQFSAWFCSSARGTAISHTGQVLKEDACRGNGTFIEFLKTARLKSCKQ